MWLVSDTKLVTYFALYFYIADGDGCDTMYACLSVIGTMLLKDYLEAATIVFLFSIAEWLESRASQEVPLSIV